MKYKYTPNCHIIDYKRGKEMFQFDANGEFETNDPKLIAWIKKNKNFLKPIQEPKKPEPEKEPVSKEPAKEEKKKVYKCKKCDFETDNVGSLMAHYRTEHKKDDKDGE